jgi:hypothetical protein
MQIFGRKVTEAEVLQASAVAVAAPRYMGAFAAAIGANIISKWPWFISVEIISGLAMALLEGWAIAFTFRRWRSLPVGTFQWYILLVPQLFLLVALPATATPYLVSSQLGKPVAEIFPMGLLWGWSFLVAAVAPLIVAAVGYSDVEASQTTPLPKQTTITPAVVNGEQDPVSPDSFQDAIFAYLKQFPDNSLPGPTQVAKDVGASKPTAVKWLTAYKQTNGLNGYGQHGGQND